MKVEGGRQKREIMNHEYRILRGYAAIRKPTAALADAY